MNDPFQEQKLEQLKVFLYLIPVLGFVPALWAISNPQSSKAEKKVSRLAIILVLLWLFTYGLLWSGATQSPEWLSLRLLYLNGLFTSGYFILCIALMWRTWQGKLPRLPWISTIAEKIFAKYLV